MPKVRDKNYIVYGLYSSADPKSIRYIGQTTNLKRRFRDHIQYAEKRERHSPLYCWIRSHIARGNRIEVKVLLRNAAWNTAEQRFIEKLGKRHKLLNLTVGGEGTLGWKPGKKWRENVSTRNSGKRWSEEAKQKRREFLKAEHPFRGRKHTDEAKLKMRKAKLGKPNFALRGKVVSQETRQKIGEASRKRLALHHHMQGKHHSEETRRKISEALKGNTNKRGFRK